MVFGGRDQTWVNYLQNICPIRWTMGSIPKPPTFFSFLFPFHTGWFLIIHTKIAPTQWADTCLLYSHMGLILLHRDAVFRPHWRTLPARLPSIGHPASPPHQLLPLLPEAFPPASLWNRVHPSSLPLPMPSTISLPFLFHSSLSYSKEQSDD